MFALLGLILALALAIALAPIILGALGTMFALIFTFILWAAAGFPDNTPKDTRPTAVQAAPAAPEGEDDPFEQMMEWERQDNERRRAYRALQRGKDRARLLDAQRRTHSADDEVDHAEP